MRQVRLLAIVLLTIPIVSLGGWSRAEDDTEVDGKKITISSLLTVEGNASTVDQCDEAREWYDEGLRLSNNSDQEAYYYKRAIEFCPDFVAAYTRLGEVYKNQGNFILSLDAFEQARIHALANPRFISRTDSRELFLESAISLGEIYRIQGKYEQAAEEFSKALQLDPSSTAAQNQLQYIYKRMHRYDNVLSPNNSLLVNGIFSRLPGMTLPEKTFSFDVQYRFWTQESLLTEDMFEDERILLLAPPEQRTADIGVAILSMRYGLTSDLTIGIIPKYFFRTLKFQLTGFDFTFDEKAEGFGDTELLFKYHVWGERNRHLSIYSRLTLPTGKEAELVGSQPLVRIGMDENFNPVTEYLEVKRYVPFGSESFDITPGIAFTLGLNPLVLQANMQYRITDGEMVGDEFQFNAAAIYRVNPSVNTLLELNYRWLADVTRRQQVITFVGRPDFVGRDRTPAGPLILDTTFTEPGGDTLFISPGIQLTVAQGVRLEFGMQIPLITQESGWAPDIVYQVGITFMNF